MTGGILAWPLIRRIVGYFLSITSRPKKYENTIVIANMMKDKKDPKSVL